MQFSTITETLPHQTDAVAKLLPSRVNALFAEMGTGKSRIAIELARLRQAKISRVVWFCPVSLRETIRHEILKHTDCTDEDLFVFDDRVDDRTVPLDRQWYVVGIESMSSSSRVVLAVRRLMDEDVFVLVDESTFIKNNRAARTERITHLSRACRYRAVLTGTPFTQGVVDLYSQMYFLSPKILGYNSFWSFAANHITWGTRTDNWGREVRSGRIKSTHDHEYLARRIAPYAYQIRKDECLDLPEKVFEERRVRLTNLQRQYYEDAKEWTLAHYADHPDPMAGILHLFTQLQTIVHGFWTRPDPDTGAMETITFPTTRPQALLGVVEAVDEREPIIVWAHYRRCVDDAVAALEEAYGPGCCREFHGGIRPRDREEQIEQWRRGDARFLVATQQTGGFGRTLVESAHAVFYSNSFKYSHRDQAEDRIHRIGQDRKALYVDIVCSDTIDERIHTSLRRKGDALKSFRKQVEACRGEGMKPRIRELIRSL